jgi:hypothetical protein
LAAKTPRKALGDVGNIQHSKISSDVKIKEKDEDTLPDIEKIVPFVDEGKNIIN